jgi:ketosteroid isomerase-like protein
MPAIDDATEGEEILRGVLDQWKAAVDAHQPQQVASYFTADAIFQGLRPYSLGRQGVADYYAPSPSAWRPRTAFSKLDAPPRISCSATCLWRSHSSTNPR